ncbi:peptidoglycan DD-metalloendopeptidase family protein [Actinomadura livida]|uniref:M23ase beta-sheet core domain-containing protein n=2 Tax=Actinomadura livida TaxID=79909 RepID=A0A7W7IG68_9ACTN|nr:MULTISPECIES: peptidoglycan DD-metalloendopeptidase family protein [Actinomadura]MBB4776499.1 hypothetical protein [Actinomadura catellatispora]
MARRDNGHASRNNTHASPWAETSARPSSRPAPRTGPRSGEPKPLPQWPEGSWWSEQPDGAERGRRGTRGPSRREMKRHEARAKRSQRREDQFGARNRPSSAEGDRFDARTRSFDARNDSSDARTRSFDARNEPPADVRARQFGVRNDPADARTRFGAPDARTRFGARNEPPAARTRPAAPWSTGEPDARTRSFDARNQGTGQRFERFDARAEGTGPGRDRSREFQPRGGRPPRPARQRAQERPARTRPPARPPAAGQARRPAPQRPGPKAKPRRGRGPADRMSIGAIVLSTAVGLSLLGIAERALLEGGPIGGTSDPAGSERALAPAGPGGNPAQQQPQSPQQPGGQAGGPANRTAAPNLAVLSAQVRKLTIDERGAAAQQAYGAPAGGRPIVDLTRTSADKTWAFGTTAIPVPTGSSAAPEVAFYAARWTGEEWQVGLSGSSAFTTLLGAVPKNAMAAAEVTALRRYGAVTTEQATALVNGSRAGDRLMLPFKTGQAWTMTTSEGSARPLGTLAFSGGDGRVLAAGSGHLYRFCSDSAGRAMVMVVHASGVATTYYRLQNVPRVKDGAVVSQGAPLGRAGTDRPCGGAASPRAEVGFGLRHGGGRVPLDGAQLGGWTFRERANPLLGFAERGALQVLPGGLIANLGSVPAGEDAPPPVPSPDPSADDGAGSTPAPGAAATQNRSQSGANSQQ